MKTILLSIAIVFFAMLLNSFCQVSSTVVNGNDTLTKTTITTDSTTSDTAWTYKTYPNQVIEVKFSPDGKYIAACVSYMNSMLFDVATGTIVRTYPSNSASIDISPDQQFLASGQSDGNVIIYGFNTSGIIKTLQYPTDWTIAYAVSTVAFTKNQKYLLVCYQDKGILVYDATTWQLYTNIAYTGGDKLIISDDNKYFAVRHYYHNDNSGYWDQADVFTLDSFAYLKTIGQITDGHSSLNDIKFSPDNKLLAIASDDGTAKIWNIETGENVKTFNHVGVINAISFAHDQKYFIESGGYAHNLTINIFDYFSGLDLYSYFNNYIISVTDVSYSLDVDKIDKYIVSGGYTGIVLLNAKFNTNSVSDNIIFITSDTIYPNPTNSTTNIEFTLLKAEQTNITIYDNNSNLITTIYNGLLTTGSQEFQWNTNNIPNGIYYCHITVNNSTSTIKIIVSK